MNNVDLKQLHSLHHQHTLRPVVIAVTAAIGISGLLVGCGGGSHHGSSKSSSGLSLATSGGNGGKTTGFGGSGGEVDLYAGADNTVINILTSKKGAPATPTIPDPDLGTEPLEITTNTTLKVDDPLTAPVDEYFQVAGDCRIFISDGDAMTVPGTDPGDRIVTGVEIANGVTLKLEDNKGLTGCIDVGNDIVNDGTLTTATQGSSLWLYADNYFGGGPITTSGGDTTPDAGDIWIGADTAIYNKGNLSAAGADSNTVDGGDGGYIELYAYSGDLLNRGKLNTSGGNSMADGGIGGDGGEVDLYAVITAEAGDGKLVNYGAIDTTGGNGDGGGGDGGTVYVWLSGPAEGDGVASSNIYMLAGINTQGGVVTGSNGDGGDGGGIEMEIDADGGNLELLGFTKITTTGGDGAEGGGGGGYVYFYSDGNDADYTNKARVDTTGGDSSVSGSGGDGGGIELYNDGGAGTINNSGNLTANGGSGVDGGGDGGSIYLYVYEGGSADMASVTNSGKLTSLGGNHTGATINAYTYAGDGGDIEVEIEYAKGTVTNTGVINVSGGNSTHGNAGHGGDVEVELEGETDDPGNAVSNTASITTNGGVGGIDGGYGGTVYFYSPGVVTTNSGTISTKGGAGDTGNGGDGGYVEMRGEPVTGKGNINASGGNGDVNGGKGGDIFLKSTGADPTDYTGTLTSTGGTGKTGDNGTDGVITVDDIVQ